MNNEPVAWTDGKGNYFDKNSFFPVDDLIPLYTHPVEEQDESFDRTASHMAGEYVSWTSCVACGQRVTGDSIHTCSPQLKQLTDEEIKFIAYPFESVYTTYDKQTDTDTVHTRFDQLGFARAILRKASEK